MGRQWQSRSAEPILTWRVGDVRIAKVPEMLLESGLDDGDIQSEGFLPEATCRALLEIDWLQPDFITDKGEIKLSFHSLVIDTGERRILVDTCVGNHKHRPRHPFWENLNLPFLEALTQAGYPRETIDTVVCTHLHVDHVGWNTMLVEGRWLPTFPNARYLIGREDHDQCVAVGATGDGESGFMPGSVFADSIQPIFDAGLVDLVPADHVICEEVALLPTPGHTPGHVSVVISSGTHRALITGDTIHHPSQLVHTEWNSGADGDPRRAIDTRRDLLARMADSDTLVIGTHWSGRSAGRVTRRDGVYALERADEAVIGDPACAI